ncbi:polymorphic toxin-type HINT domain-containing protein [Streptomyces griseoincarnatus]
MADGTTKPIEDVKTGDKVVATDPETGETRIETVTAEIKGKGLKHLVKVVIDTDGDKGEATAEVTATDGHPFWVPELGTWLDATDLQPGQWLQTSAGTYVQITAIERWTTPGTTVHNLTVGDTHTYYVLAGAAAVLVHNCGATEDDAWLAHDRAQELQSMRDDYYGAHYNGTTAVIGVLNADTGKISIRIGINGGGAQPSAWSLRPGEEFVQAAGHAEAGILNSLAPNEHAIFGATTINFCNDTCFPLMNVRGMTLAGGFGHKPHNSPFRLFWLSEED